MSKINLNEVPMEGVVPPLPRDTYTIRITEATFGLSKSSGKPMITLTTEFVRPTEIQIGETKYDLTSVPGPRYYLILEQQGGHLGRVRKFHEVMSLPMEIDTDNPDTNLYAGLMFEAMISTREKKAMKQGADGKFVPTVDPVTGKEYIQGYEYNAQITDVLAPSTFQS